MGVRSSSCCGVLLLQRVPSLSRTDAPSSRPATAHVAGVAPGPAPVVEVLAASPLPTLAWSDLLDTTAPCVPDEAATTAVRLALGTQRVVR